MPLARDSGGVSPHEDAIREYLASTGLKFELLPVEREAGEGLGAQIRRGVALCSGETVVIVDPDLPYRIEAIGDAVALIQSGATDIVFGWTSRSAEPKLLRWIIGTLPDPAIYLKAFSRHATRLVVDETKLDGDECGIEIAFLAAKYGFRIEKLSVSLQERAPAKAAFSIATLVDAVRVRVQNRRMEYRPARRCPVCFSSDVRTFAQLSGNVVRVCLRCKCRYLNEIPAQDQDALPMRRTLRPHPPAKDAAGRHSDGARQKTSRRRVAAMRKKVTPHARILEVGIRDGSFGRAASKEFEYVGIDISPAAVRNARVNGLEAYTAALSTFVNSGRAFDAVVLHHVFENMPDPHDALARAKDLLAPGGVLVLTTFDTEGLLYGITERRLIAQLFGHHTILYSRSALIELLEHSGFEIEAINADFEYRDHRLVRHWFASHWPALAPLVNAVMHLLPDPMLVSSGSICVVSQRRAGAPFEGRIIRAVEPTHAR